LAILEYFVHLTPDDPPPDLVLAIAEVPSGISCEEIEADHLPARWRDTPAIPELAAIGDDFVHRAEHVALLVPSVLSPSERNWLLNPAHADFKKIAVRETEPLNYDVRLLPQAHRSRTRGSSR
jgi:RES domain-containing protein